MAGDIEDLGPLSPRSGSRSVLNRRPQVALAPDPVHPRHLIPKGFPRRSAVGPASNWTPPRRSAPAFCSGKSSTTIRDAPSGWRCQRVPLRTSELPFKIGEGVDDFRSFKGTIALADRYLIQHLRRNQTSDCLVGLLKASPDQFGCSADRHDGCAWKSSNESSGGRVGADAADSFAPGLFDFADALLVCESIGHRTSRCRCECTNPKIQSVVRGRRCLVSAVPRCRQPRDVVIGARCEDERNRREHPLCKTATSHNDVDECTSGSTVSIHERVDGFDLRVRDCGLRNRRQRVAVAKRAEIVKQILHLLMRRRDVRSGAGVEATSANPVLLLSDPAAVALVTCSRQEPPVDLQEPVDRDCFAWRKCVDGP